MAQMDPLFIAGGIRGLLRFLRVRARWRKLLGRLRRTAAGRLLLRFGNRARRLEQLRLRRGESAFGEVTDEAVRLMEAHSRMRAKYELQPWPGRVHVFLSDGWIVRKHDPVPLWEELARGGLEVIHVPGRHVSMLAEPNVAVLAGSVREALASFER